MEDELKSIQYNKFFEISWSSRRFQSTGCKWIFEAHKDSKEIDDYKARFVAKGLTKREGVDYIETFIHVS